jgi:serine/threonine-protein kinase RsbW
MQSLRTPGLAPGAVITEVGPAVNAASATTPRADAAGGATSAARRFPAVCQSVREARWFLLEHLRAGGDEDLGPHALMLSELATNAVQHAGTAFEVAITVTPEVGGRCVHVRVTDEAPGFPVPQEPLPDAPRGRGLRIVKSLADAWGIEMRHGEPGKTVWFTSRLEPTPAPVEPVDEFGDDEHQVGITVGALVMHTAAEVTS